MTSTSSGKPIIQINGLSKEYRTGDVPFMALNAIELEVGEGEFLGITGKSGAGKTTLLNMISGVSHPTHGEIYYFGGSNGASRFNGSPLPIHTLNEDELARWRGENLGIVYQSFELMPNLNLVQNVMLPPDFSGSFHPKVSREKALELLDLVDIADHAYKIPAHISGGQKQRVAIARALVNDPPLIVADEPTGNLDTVTAETIFQIFEKLVDQGRTIIMVTHDESLAGRFGRRLHIVDGKLGHPPENGSSQPAISRASSVAADEFVRVQSSPTTLFPPSHDVSEEQAPPEGASADHPAILLKGVEKIYENAAGKFTALRSIDLQLNYGQFISVVGKSGSGKSTLLNMITGIDHPTSGEVIIGNQHIYKMTESERALWRGRNIGVVFQFFQLLPTLSLLENTMLPMDYCNVYDFQERPERAMELLMLVGLEGQAHMLPANVSSGQQQSAAIARSLATNPAIILADEPTGNLDSRSAGAILDLFERLANQGKTIMIVTHDPAITKRTDQTVILSDGEIVDNAIARALPFLSHPQMLAATHQARKQRFLPNTTILRQGDPVDHFFMVSAGEVDILLENQTCGEMILARLGPGQFFGEVELTHGGNSIASVRSASGNPVELAMLPRAEFFRLIDGSSLTRNVLKEVATSRLGENRRSQEREC
jgi:ABC-type lipoprotein export system ATPase subunit